MRKEGVECVVPMESFSNVGLVEVVSKLPAILRNMGVLKRVMVRRKPRVFIPIDVPDVNLRLSTFARRKGIPVVYFISPQIWAWRRGRVRRISRDVRKMLVILPFEVNFYSSSGVDAEFVGHPLVDQLARHGPERPGTGSRSTRGVVGLFPGSRSSETERMLPLFQEVVISLLSMYPELRFRLFLAPGFSQASLPLFPDAVSVERDVPWWERGDLQVALAASGTVTLELGLLGVPTVVVYRLNGLTHALARRWVTCAHISLVNLILEKAIFPELIQKDAKVDRIVEAMDRFLRDEGEVERVRTELNLLRQRMGKPGCSRRVATKVLEIAGLSMGKEEA